MVSEFKHKSSKKGKMQYAGKVKSYVADPGAI